MLLSTNGIHEYPCLMRTKNTNIHTGIIQSSPLHLWYTKLPTKMQPSSDLTHYIVAQVFLRPNAIHCCTHVPQT